MAHPSQQTLVGEAALGVEEGMGVTAVGALVAAVVAVVPLGPKRLALATGPAPTAITSALPASTCLAHRSLRHSP